MAETAEALRRIPKPQSDAEVPAYISRVREVGEVRAAEASYEAAEAGDSTFARYCRGGRWDPGRAALHRRIVSELLNPEAADEVPLAVVLMGLPGSGKSSRILPGVYAEWPRRSFTTVNPDEVKARLPEYIGRTAPFVHEESAYVAKVLLVSEAIALSHNVVLDEVGGGAEAFADRLKNMNEQGYEVHVRYASAPVHVCVGRVVDRFLATGRWVPLDYIAGDLARRIESTFNLVSRKAYVASARKVLAV